MELPVKKAEVTKMDSQNKLIGFLIFILVITTIGGNFLSCDYRYLFETFFYFILAILIWIGKENLQFYNISSFSVLLFLLGGLFWWLHFYYDLHLIYITAPIMFIVSLILTIKLFRNGYIKIPRNKITLKPIFFGLVLGLLISLVFSILGGVSSSEAQDYSPSLIFISIVIAFIQDLIHISIMEEMIFRGFLWGFFRTLGWSERNIWVSTSFLFWLAHIWQIINPYSLFIVVPIAGLLFGFLVYRYQSISGSVVAHSAYNSTRIIILNVIKLFMKL